MIKKNSIGTRIRGVVRKLQSVKTGFVWLIIFLLNSIYQPMNQILHFHDNITTPLTALMYF